MADIVVLDSGGTLAGQVDKEDSPERSKLLLYLPGGGRAVLERSAVEKTVEQTPELIEYQSRAVTSPDTVETHYAIAMWCRERKLKQQFDDHLARVLELDPNHTEARKLLGYRMERGRWMTQEQRMAARGLIRYEGDFRTAQEIELMQRRQRGAEDAAAWRKRLERWRRDLDSANPKEVHAAVTNFERLTQPAAAGALVRLLHEEENLEARDLLIQAASQIEHPGTVEALATLSLKDPRREVRMQCLEHLIKAGRPGLADIHVKSLKSKDNQIVNRAGEALRVLGAEETISPLIDSLVTTHTIKVGSDSPRDTYSMSSGGGFQFGGGSAKTVKVTLQNPEVLSALVEITGQNFQFDEQAWSRWVASRVATQEIDLRRDE